MNTAALLERQNKLLEEQNRLLKQLQASQQQGRIASASSEMPGRRAMSDYDLMLILSSTNIKSAVARWNRGSTRKGEGR